MSASNEQINSKLSRIENAIASIEQIAQKINADLLIVNKNLEEGTFLKPFLAELNNKVDRLVSVSEEIINIVSKGNPEITEQNKV